MLNFIPLPAALWLVYNGLVLTGVVPHALYEPLALLELPSKTIWSVTLGDGLIFAGIFLLCVEVFKATRSNAASILDHTLSLLVFVAFLVEFLLTPQAGNSVFFTLLLMTMIDVVAGFSVTIVAARRDVDLER